jgi:magnesium-transporting ATPase (P-type)
MTRLRSTTILFGCVAFFAAVTFGMWCVMWEPPLPPLGRLLFGSLVFGVWFGDMAWSVLTVPDKAPRNDGWRKYRFFMWWAAIIAVLQGTLLYRGATFRFWGDFVPIFGASLALTTMGWAFASIRAHRARQEEAESGLKKVFGSPDFS